MQTHPPSSLLLTPGPVSLPMSTKRTMLEDHAFGGRSIVKDIAFARRYLVHLANAANLGTAIPLPGSGTYANEAAIQTFVPEGGKLLVHSNGVYGDTLVSICRATGTPHSVLRTSPVSPPSAEQFRQALCSDPGITHVMMVHCETSSGLLNPIDQVGRLCRELHKVFIVDAVATFGALPLDMRRLAYDVLVLSSNKCLEGPPGLAWVVANRGVLGACKGNARSLCLDLWDQNQHVARTSCFRFTPPTHTVSAVAQALRAHDGEGGSAARLERYRRNWRSLVERMRSFGFRTLLPDTIAAPIAAVFREPDDPAYDFDAFYLAMLERGLDIYPGPLAVQRTFRIGCIGTVTEHDMRRAADAVRETLTALGVRAFGAARARPAPVASIVPNRCLVPSHDRAL